jgi:PAS domain S-box-containing protein
MGKRGPNPRISKDNLKEIFESNQHGVPYTSNEVAEQLQCAQTTAYKKLQELVEDDVLQSKKVGARGRVWWLQAEKEYLPSTSESKSQADRFAAEDDTFRAIFEEAFDAMLIADDDGTYVDANPAACDLFGLSRDELLGRSIDEFAAGEYDFETAWREFQESDRSRGLFPLVRADGEERTVEFGATPNIIPHRHLSILRDVTEFREVKTQLQDEHDRAQRYQKTIHSDEILELEFQLTDNSDFLVAVSDQLDCYCDFQGMVSTKNGTMLHYVWVENALSEEVLAMAKEAHQVNDCRVIHELEMSGLFEVDLKTSALKTLIEAGANGRTAIINQGRATIVAEVAPDVDLHTIVDVFLNRYTKSELVSKRKISRPFMTTRQYHKSLKDRLTDRQIETLRSAHLAGYFEWPRQSTAEEVAMSMGIASPTWLRHLRKAEVILVQSFFEELAI